jgi:NAD(P)-dependent dehydrogenase (short-subunit alcohol dehydrogenase family)
LYLTADVHSGEAVRAALAEVRRELGPITGLVHAAGVIHDRRIAEKSDEQWARVFETKVLGLRALLDATCEDALTLLCLFSSVAGRFGNEGQADYAMANEVLSKVAAVEARRRGHGCVVKALHWGPWDGGMVGAGLKAHFESRGVSLIPLEAGARQFVAELAGAAAAGGGVETVIGASLTHASQRPRGERQVTLEFHVSEATHAFLDGHRLKGIPVVPVVLALEWLARAAAACRPDLVLSELRDVRVRRGIRLARFEGGGESFRVGCREVKNGSSARLALEIRSLDGTLHYSADAEMAAALEIPPPALPHAPSLEIAPWSVERLYPELLFHGESFRVIRSLEGVSERAAAAVVKGVAEQGWRMGSWQLDAAALDGGLQLAILLGHRALGRASLPTRIGRLRLFHSGPAAADLQCRSVAKDVSPLRTLQDVWLGDAQGRPFAEIGDLEMHALPAQPDASEAERSQPALS